MPSKPPPEPGRDRDAHEIGPEFYPDREYRNAAPMPGVQDPIFGLIT
jgi:hypothetical protein